MRHVSILAAIAAVSISSSALAVTVDGTRDASYGAAIVVQQVQTQFGDANPQQGNQGGSELNAAYARIEGGRLFVMLTGNIEPNFNKLNVFIDSKAGGENVLSREPAYDFNPGGGGFYITQNMGGMTFDSAFSADYHLLARTGDGRAQVDFADRQGGANYSVPNSAGNGSNFAGLVSTGSIAAGAPGANANGSPLTQSLDFAHNNNNSAGVTGGTGPADQTAAALVSTGFEFSVALVDIGSPSVGDVIRVAAMIGNGDHNYLSNQILGGLPGNTGNLGGDGAGGFTGTLSGVNFNNYAGEQFFSIVVPEPSSLGLAGVVGLAALRRRRA